jgi:Tfp pilus assembly protein PilN
MKAVNLIPGDEPKLGRSKGAIASPTGPIGAYIVLAVLAVVVVMAGASALTSKHLSDKKNELSRIETQAAAAEAKAASLSSYTEFAALRKARVDTVGGLLDGRFDWAHSLREIARVVPRDVPLTSLVGTVSPSSKVEGGGASTLRPALPVPAVDLIGCAKSQAHVARLLARLRSLDGVQRVSLASSEKSDGASENVSDCRSTVKMPQFQLTVFYKALDGIVPATDATTTSSTSAATAASTTASAGGAK